MKWAKERIQLKILLPFGVLVAENNVRRIIADTSVGSLGILPHRMDCVAILVPGIFVFETPDDGEVYVAVDRGILIKTGMTVLVSVRNGVIGTDLHQLQDTIEQEFTALTDQEQAIRLALFKMESTFVQGIMKEHHEKSW